MQRGSIKATFGGEVPFTKFISEDHQTQQRLLEALNLAVEDGYTVKPENPTQDNKRVDLTVQDTENNTILVIESQDATGWLDSVHASKIMYYMWDKDCDQGVILTEDADEYIMSFVRKLNTDHNFSITLLKTLIYTTEETPKYVDFVPLIRGSNIDYVGRSSLGSGYQGQNPETKQRKQELSQEVYDLDPQFFTHVSTSYASRNNVAGTGLNVAVNPYANSNDEYFVEIWHAGKADTDEFRRTFTEACKSAGLEARFQSRRGYVKQIGQTNAVKAARQLASALEDKSIRV